MDATMKEVIEMKKALESVSKTLIKIDKTLLLQQQQLAEHMRRTDLLEKELKPVTKFQQQFIGAGKLLGILAVIATIATIWSVFK